MFCALQEHIETNVTVARDAGNSRNPTVEAAVAQLLWL